MPTVPRSVAGTPRHDRVRRLGAVLVVTAGAANLVSASLPPAGGGLRLVLRVVPLFVPQTADALVAISALVLLAVARGIRRGQRQAWLVAIVLLTLIMVKSRERGSA